ncbi:MAG: proteasome accessory factor PafA2 family protein [Candidatus Bathyarchaeota archaeon]|nr:proteasome accessory factor PafA2 family protein [Candidatus Bathyarchaeota archaeon]
MRLVFEAHGLMEHKIRGVEHELAMNTQPQLPHRSLIHLVGMAIEELRKAELVTGIKVEEPRLDYMAYNGFRVYDDMSHLELSSPSYNSSMEAVIYDRVAELFGYYAVKGLRSYFKGINGYKNNVSNIKEGDGWRANSYSTHSSILMDRRVCGPDVWDKMEDALVPFMVARIPVIGGGDYVPCKRDGSLPRPGKIMNGETLRFVISPRAAFIKRVSSNDTVDARGILNQRNDPHADPEKYWRFHDINWEGLRSPFQIYLRDNLETLVMTAYEKGYYQDAPKLDDPVASMKEMTTDTEALNWKLTLADGTRVDAVADILEGFYLAGVEEMLSREESTEADRRSFNLIKATVQRLQERSLEYFIDGLDWVTKKTLIDEYAEGDIEEGLGICNQYTLLDETVLRYIGETVEVDETTFSLDDSMEFARDAIPFENWDALTGKVKHALHNGPEGTREYIRCLAAREFPGLLKSIEWESINFHNASIRLDEPFIFNKQMCGDVLEKATGTFTEFTKALDKLNQRGDHMMYAPSDDHEKHDTE